MRSKKRKGRMTCALFGQSRKKAGYFLKKFEMKNQMLAGRSARRRMK